MKKLTQMSPEEMAQVQVMLDNLQARKAKQQAYNEHRRVWMLLMVKKAEKAKIGVSEKEITEYIAANQAK